MKHGRVRDQLTRGEAGPDVALHLESCPECAAFARRLETAREVFRTTEAGIVPGPEFARRVVARLPQPAEVLGWAALRALPAALALAVALLWLGISQPAPPEHLLAAEASPDQLLTLTVLAPVEVAP